MYTRAEYEAEIDIIEQQRAHWRKMVVAASVKNNPWRYDGLKTKEMLDWLDAQQAHAERKLRMVAVNAGAMAREKAKEPAVKAPVRTRLGYFWKRVGADTAVRMRQAGMEVRFIGVGWEVKIS